ncbi:MAG: hypothetical protein AB1816_15415 [Bacillota bacterium]
MSVGAPAADGGPRSEMRRENAGRMLVGLGAAMIAVGRVGERALVGFLREAAHWRPRDTLALVAAGLATLAVMVVLTVTLYAWLPLGLLVRAAGRRLAGESHQLGYRPAPVSGWW